MNHIYGHQILNHLICPIPPSPKNHALFCKFNKKQHVMFTLAAKAC